MQLGRVDELAIVNKEMYSSRLKDFSVRVRLALICFWQGGEIAVWKGSARKAST